MKPAEKLTFLHVADRWMWPLKSDGSQIVTSALEDDTTSKWNFVERVGVKFRHYIRKQRRISKADNDQNDGTYDFDFDGVVAVVANVHTQPMINRLVLGTVVWQDE